MAGAVLVGLAGSAAGADGATAAGATAAGATSAMGQSVAATDVTFATSTGAPGFRRGGAGPLYWSTYDYEEVTNAIIPEDVWKTNIDWVADTFRDYGYTMVCTDGWIDNTQKITPHGYIVSQADDWEHDWAWWAKYLKSQGHAARRLLQPLVGHPVPPSRIPR